MKVWIFFDFSVSEVKVFQNIGYISLNIISLTFTKLKQFPRGQSQFKVDRLQIILVAKIYISTSRNCSSVGCLKCVQVHNWFRLH